MIEYYFIRILFSPLELIIFILGNNNRIVDYLIKLFISILPYSFKFIYMLELLGGEIIEKKKRESFRI